MLLLKLTTWQETEAQFYIYYLLFKQQYGFRNKMPTNEALIDIFNRIIQACDNGQYACGIYVDFKKTLDTVNHNALLDKLAHYRVRGLENDWFKTYLTNRTQHVTVNGQTWAML